MSLRSVGNQLLQTAPSRLLGGASKASASFWVRVNPGNALTSTSGVEVFGDTAGVFSATLAANGGLRLQWSSNDGHVASTSACTVYLTPGTSYHVAATWQAGSQLYYLNGVQVASDTQGGSLGLLGGTPPRPFRLGSDKAGTDVTLGQPTLWAGYALTAQDVASLRDRKVQPGVVAPASIVLEWSLAGLDGAVAGIGDVGLADASPSNLALSSIVGTAPTYQAADLTYVAAPTANPAAAPSGESIVLLPLDPSGNPTGVTSVGNPGEVQSIRFLVAPSGNAFTLSFGGATTAPIPVTVTAPAIFFTWSVPVASGHALDVAVNWYHDIDNPGPAGQQYFYEVIDGQKTLCTSSIGSAIPANQFADGTAPYGNPLYWDPVSPTAGVTPSGTTLQVRYTAASAGMAMGGLRVHDRATGKTTIYDLTQTQYWATNPPNPNSQPQIIPWSMNQNVGFNGGLDLRYDYQGSGIGPIVAITGGAQALTTALQSLASIPQGDIVVVDASGVGTGHYQVQFVKGLGNSSQPLISCADPNVSVTRDNPGGQGIMLSKNGGAPVLLGDQVYRATAAFPFLQLVLPQAAPAVQTRTANMQPVYPAVLDRALAGLPGSFSGGPICGWSAGQSASCPFQLLPPGTYQVAITYPVAPFTYNGGNYAPSATTQFLVQDDLGNILATYTIDQSRPITSANGYQTQALTTPDGRQDPAGRWWRVLGSFTTTKSRDALTLTMTTVGQSAATVGSAQAVAILDAVQLTRTSPDNSVTIGPGDVATLSIPAGWITTAAGPIPAAAAMPVAPPSPTSILPPFVAGPKSMKIGYNVPPVGRAQNLLHFSNLAYLMDPMGYGNSDGYPTLIAADAGHAPGNHWAIVIGENPTPQFGEPPQGAHMINPGRFVLAAQCDGALSLVPGLGTTVTQVAVPKPSNLVGNVWQVYDIRYDPSQVARPCFYLSMTGTTPNLTVDPSGNTLAINMSNLRIYPPDPTDPTGNTIWGLNTATNTWTEPPKFHPWFLYKLQGVNNLRFLDALATNTNPAFSFSHYKPVTHANRIGPTNPGVGVAVASIHGAAPGEGYFNAGEGPVLVIQTAAPHNLFDGLGIAFSGCGTGQFTNGQSLLIDSNAAGGINVGAVIKVMGPTTLHAVLKYSPFGSMTNATTGGSIGAAYGTQWPLQDIVDLVAAVPTVTDLHFNTPINIDTSVGGGAEQVAGFLAARLPAGVKVHVEPGNECWNFQFITNFWCALVQAHNTNQPSYVLKYEQQYADIAAATHARFDAAFSAAGRPNDVIHLYGTFTANPQNTAQILARAQQNGARVDEVCIAPYVNEGVAPDGYDAGQMPIFNRMTVDQVMDYTELCAEYGGWGEFLVGNQYPVLQQYGYPNAKVIGYEGSVADAVPVDPSYSTPPPGNTPDYYLRRNQARRHPRIYGITLRLCQIFQDAGLAMWNYFHLGGSTDSTTWDAYESGNQQRGTGDPVADAINVTSFQDKNSVLCEVGGAVHRWATLVPSTTTTTTTTNKKVALRNGRIGAIGLPRGLFRPLRGR